MNESRIFQLLPVAGQKVKLSFLINDFALRFNHCFPNILETVRILEEN